MLFCIACSEAAPGQLPRTPEDSTAEPQPTHPAQPTAAPPSAPKHATQQQTKPPPSFLFSSRPLNAEERRQMMGKSWHPGCPLALEALRLIQVNHFDLKGALRQGELVAAESEVKSLRLAFRGLFEAHFPIESLRPIRFFGGNDDRSMAANNSSAFNCRAVTGGTHFSEHAYGRALDLNPRFNPYVNGKEVLPPAGVAYLDRALKDSGLFHEGGPGVRAMSAAGWRWGGDWRSLKDYQHFSRSGR